MLYRSIILHIHTYINTCPGKCSVRHEIGNIVTHGKFLPWEGVVRHENLRIFRREA
jgi:hypothetical protein